MTLTMQSAEAQAPTRAVTAPVPSEDPVSLDLERALSACNFALVVWDTPEGSIRVANRAAAELFGLPLSAVPGRRMVDLFAPRDKVEDVIRAFSSNAVDVTRTDRHVRTSGGQLRNVRVWSRTIELAETRVVVSLFVPSNETARLGRDPSAPWRDLVPIAVGFTDGVWRVERVSRDIEAIVHTSSEHIIGGSLLNLVHPDDVSELLGADGRIPDAATAYGQLRVRDGEGSWVEACLLTAPDDGSRQAFALIGPPAPSFDVAEDRVVDLERRLRQIGAEVRAAGLLDEIRSMPRRDEHPQLAQLTSRQWEVLVRLLRGDRVPAVARDLYVSQSTVRNHLSAIFHLFGVHSQAELLALLRTVPP